MYYLVTLHRGFSAPRNLLLNQRKFFWFGSWINFLDVSNHFFKNVIALMFIVNFCGNDVHPRNESIKVKQSVLPLGTSNNIFDTVIGRNSLLYYPKENALSPKSRSNNSVLSSNLNFDFNTSNSSKVHRKQAKASILRRSVRQIVPLATSNGKTPSFTDILSVPHEVERVTRLYKDFLIEYVLHKEWSNAKILIPKERFESICYYFTIELLLSRASLTVNCSTNEQTIFQLGEPVIIADFLDNTKQSFTWIYQHLLINYLPRRPFLLLAGNESISKLFERVRPEAQRNYKWTLVLPTLNETEQLNVFDIFGFATSETPLPQRIGDWSETDGLFIEAANATSVISFESHQLRVTTLAGPPVVNLLPSTDLLIAKGYLPDILDSLGVLLNFKFVILTPADGKFGDKDQNGNWSGMVGMLQRNEADIALMSFSLTKSRLAAMDFSPPVEYSSTRLLIRRDVQIAELKWDAFFRPFEWKVWAAIPVVICLGALTLISFAYFQLIETTPCESIWLLSTCFLLQGQSEHSTIRVTPFRIASGTFWILAVFIFACYTARLTSFLAADTEKLPVRDLGEAVKSKTWKVGLVKGSPFLEKVKESRAEEMVLLWKRLQDDSSVLASGFQDGISKVYKDRYIFFTSELIPSFLVKGNCSYAWLPGKYFPGFGSMGYQKGLPYSSAISHMVAKLRETGQMRRLVKKWWGTDYSCSKTGGDAFMAISLHETGSAFLILIIGASVSASLVLIEFILTAKKDNWQTNPPNKALSTNEFGAPIMHGTMHNFTPLLDNSNDRPIVWNVEDKMQGLKGVHPGYAHQFTLATNS